MDISFEIVVGTYEQFLLGYKFGNASKKTTLTQSFATHEHTGSIRCVAIGGNHLATGATDDRIVVYDMKRRKEHCMLTHHNSTINCLEFTPLNTHLISGSVDGVLSIARVGNWQLEKLWEKPHKGAAVIALAVHSTGKLALTLGSDYTLRTWNLVKGRQAYAINLTTKSADAKSLDSVTWCPNDRWFSLTGGLYTEIWSIETGGMVYSVKHESRVVSCCWLDEETCVGGLENGRLSVLNVTNRRENTLEAHAKRVKCLKRYENWLVSADSAGEIKVWIKDSMELVAKCSTGCRITCLALVPLFKIKKEKSNDTAECADSSVAESADSSAVESVHDEEEDEDEEEEDDDEIKQTVQKKKRRRCKRNKNAAKEKVIEIKDTTRNYTTSSMDGGVKKKKKKVMS